MNCMCAYTLVNVDGSKVKVPLDAVLPGERPEMEKVYVDVPQIEYVPRPRDIPSCCAFIYKCVRGYVEYTHYISLIKSLNTVNFFADGIKDLSSQEKIFMNSRDRDGSAVVLRKLILCGERTFTGCFAIISRFRKK